MGDRPGSPKVKLSLVERTINKLFYGPEELPDAAAAKILREAFDEDRKNHLEQMKAQQGRINALEAENTALQEEVDRLKAEIK